MTYSRRHLFQLMAAAGIGSQWTSTAADRTKQNMIVRSPNPLDLEMTLDGFNQWITPVERFFVRSHHYTPTVNLQEWRLSIAGEVNSPQTLTMDDIKRLPRVELVSVLECAGNGRALYEPPVPGAQWVYGAVGNGRWAGVRLADVLAKAGVKSSASQILLDGADVPMGTMPEFLRTVPLKKALDRDTLLAYEMNGEPLSMVHGFPLRLVVPGWGGDSWTKWVTAIKVLDKEYDGFFMKTAYRHPGKPVPPGAAVDAAQMRPVENLNVKSVIAGPLDDAKVAPGPVRIHGTAWSGESPVSTVEVSVDRGRTWQKARLGADQSRYAWRLWETTWTPREPGYYIVMARATDAAGRMQPMVQEWNPSGYLYNVVQQVAVEVAAGAPKSDATAAGGTEAPPAKEFQAPANFKSACLPCHDEQLIMQQRLTRVQWEREVDKMVRWGAKVNPQDRESIMDYVVRLYGSRPRK
jgi:DMSO/TMAO reductase YedYZ molybdopterin-dependent catalytic subunit